MFHIVNTDHVYADLLVFEKDAPLVRTGQHVTLSLKSASGAQYTGTVLSVGKTFEQSPKVVHVRTSIDGSRKGLITGMYLCGQIASDTKHLPALPEEGIVDDGGKSYLFTVKRQKNKWTFHPVEIKKGREEGGFIEILGCPLNSSTVVALNNAYYLLSEMKKGETGEE
jgi:cobalt-zinc-cadmium efflux system membrane fusion protein